MKKILGLLTSLLILNGCAESIALLGPASSALGTSAIGGGKIVHSTLSSAASYGIKYETGKTPAEHAIAYVKKHNPEQKKEKCVNFLRSTKTKTCAAIKENILKSRKKIAQKSKIKFLNKN